MPAAGSPWPRLGGVKITLQRAIQLYIDQWPKLFLAETSGSHIILQEYIIISTRSEKTCTTHFS